MATCKVCHRQHDFTGICRVCRYRIKPDDPDVKRRRRVQRKQARECLGGRCHRCGIALGSWKQRDSWAVVGITPEGKGLDYTAPCDRLSGNCVALCNLCHLAYLENGESWKTWRSV